MRHHRVIPTAMRYISCLRRAKMQTALGTQNDLAPRTDMGRKNIREQMHTPARAYQLCLSYVMCVAENSDSSGSVADIEAEDLFLELGVDEAASLPPLEICFRRAATTSLRNFIKLT